MKRHRLIPTAPPSRGMDATLIVPPRPQATAPAPSANCGCGPITAVWANNNSTILASPVPDGDTVLTYIVVLGGVLPEGSFWAYGDTWQSTSPGEGGMPTVNFTGAGYAVWAWVNVNPLSETGVLTITFYVACPGNPEPISTEVMLIVGSGGYGSGSG